MATIYILVMKRYENADHWIVSDKATTKDKLTDRACYDDPPCAVWPKADYSGREVASVTLPRCTDLTKVDDGKVYEITY